MKIWLGLLRVLLVIALFVGSTPQMAMAGSEATALHATMMAMPQGDMSSGKDTPKVDYCKQHCLVVVAVLAALKLPAFEVRRVVQTKPSLEPERLSAFVGLTGPPPRSVAI